MKKEKVYEYVAYFCLAVGLICFLVFWMVLRKNGWGIADNVDVNSIDASAKVGDFVGGVIGSFWALAGVFLYFSALRMQSKEIANQVKEMSESKKLSNQQQFETSFFNLLRTQQEIKNDLKGTFYSIVQDGESYRINSHQYCSGEFFERAFIELRRLFSVYRRSSFSNWIDDEVEYMLRSFWEERNLQNPDPDEENNDDVHKLFFNLDLKYLTSFYRIKDDTVKSAQAQPDELLTCQCIYGNLFLKYENELGHYCRHLYNIVKYIDTEYESALRLNYERKDISSSEIEQERVRIKARFDGYIGFLHSILSISEMSVLFYNSLLFDKARELYVKWDLFDNLRKEALIKSRHAHLLPDAQLKGHEDIFGNILKVTKAK